jgi:hypothetical protein
MENGVSRKGKLEMILRKANDWRVRIILRMIKGKVGIVLEENRP